MAEVSPAAIKKTQDSLGKFVKKPPLTEKLLKKPPFRFLHDVINAVIKDTGFLKGLFKPEELVSDNVKDREAKVAFLQKLIDVTSLATNKTISAKPSKIVAGQEPEKTNELLQIIGWALQNKIDSKKAVEEFKNRQTKETKVTVKKSSTTTTKSVSKKSPPIQTEKIPDEAEKKPRVDSGIVEDGNAAQEDVVAVKEEKEEKEKENAEILIETSTVPQEVTKEEPPVENNVSLEPSTTSPPDSLPKPQKLDEKQELIAAIDEEADRRKKEKEVKKIVRKPSSDSLLKDQTSLDPPPSAPKVNGTLKRETTRKNLKKDESKQPDPEKQKQIQSHPPPVRPRTSLRPPSVRPPSARPGAPRKRDRNVEVVLQPEDNLQLGDINVKVEQFKASLDHDDDDDENLIVIENVSQDTLLADSQTAAASIPSTTSVVAVDGDNQGQLVKQILESQKEFQSEQSGNKSNDSLSKINNNNVSELREQIQRMTKSIQPLGKFMDFLLEDIDSMQREYEMWRERGKEVSVKLAREKNSTGNTVQSLRHQLEEVELELAETRNAIVSVRAESILLNKEKVHKLFKNF